MRKLRESILSQKSQSLVRAQIRRKIILLSLYETSTPQLTNVIGILHIREKDVQREECVVFVGVYRRERRER